jgi:hypothetical protein
LKHGEEKNILDQRKKRPQKVNKLEFKPTIMEELPMSSHRNLISKDSPRSIAALMKKDPNKYKEK